MRALAAHPFCGRQEVEKQQTIKPENHKNETRNQIISKSHKIVKITHIHVTVFSHTWSGFNSLHAG